MKRKFKLKNIIILLLFVFLAGWVVLFVADINVCSKLAPACNAYGKAVAGRSEVTIKALPAKEISAHEPEEVKDSKNIQPCTKWVSSNPAPADSICVLDSFKGFETDSDVLVWSYNLKQWDKPVGHGDINTKTVLVAGSEEFGYYYPLYVKCPWGCSFSLIEVGNNK